MKNLFRKYGYLTVFSIILVVMGIYGYMNTGLPEWIAAIPVSFTVEDEEHTVDIELYRDENACYVFLPSYASLEKVKINVKGDENYFLGERVDLSLPFEPDWNMVAYEARPQ